LTSGQLFVTNNLSIIGPWATNLEVSGNGSSAPKQVDLGTSRDPYRVTVSFPFISERH
jgi:hypothetical protein